MFIATSLGGVLRRPLESTSTSRSATPSVSPRPASNLPSAASGIRTTTRLPRQSMACSRLRSSTGAGRGEASKRWSSPRSNGSIGSITVASSSRSATFRRRRRKSAIMPSLRNKPSRLNSSQHASDELGTVHPRCGRPSCCGEASPGGAPSRVAVGPPVSPSISLDRVLRARHRRGRIVPPGTPCRAGAFP